MDAAAALRRYLEDAHAALARGEAADAERHAKAVSALVRAEREAAEFVVERQSATEDDDEHMRAELRRRLALYAQADVAGASHETLARIALSGSAE